ncbi:MAG: hypothetical protein IJS32_02165 [Kiritimatiellae bacterium]|nr:hypothetical protein [Kiritimatiellia bacterium]
MKSGAICCKDTTGTGDGIRTFAAMRHLPRVDCLPGRETLAGPAPAARKGKPAPVPPATPNPGPTPWTRLRFPS